MLLGSTNFQNSGLQNRGLQNLGLYTLRLFRQAESRKPFGVTSLSAKGARTLAASLFFLAIPVLSGTFVAQAQAQDRVILRGNYYREHSTRVLQPQVVFQKDALDHRLQVSVDYLLDVISSASIAAGAAALGGDKVFTEWRHESGASLGYTHKGWRFGVGGRYSTESDYTAKSGRISLQKELFDRNSTVSMSYAHSRNHAYRVRNNIGDRSPWTSTGDSNLLAGHQASLGWTQVFHPRVLGGAVLEASALRGPQDNPYRRARNGQNERHPLQRNRLALSFWTRALVHRRWALAPMYRFYIDSWKVSAHSLDLRLHLRAASFLRLRARYRFYWQSGAFFWRADGDYDAEAPFITDDPKTAQFVSHTPGLQLTWMLSPIAEHLKQPWLQGAEISATYNHVFQSSRFPSARMGSLAMMLPF